MAKEGLQVGIQVDALVREIFEPVQACAIRHVGVGKGNLNDVLDVTTDLDRLWRNLYLVALKVDFSEIFSIDLDPLYCLAMEINENVLLSSIFELKMRFFADSLRVLFKF